LVCLPQRPRPRTSSPGLNSEMVKVIHSAEFRKRMLRSAPSRSANSAEQDGAADQGRDREVRQARQGSEGDHRIAGTRAGPRQQLARPAGLARAATFRAGEDRGGQPGRGWRRTPTRPARCAKGQALEHDPAADEHKPRHTPILPGGAPGSGHGLDGDVSTAGSGARAQTDRSRRRRPARRAPQLGQDAARLSARAIAARRSHGGP